MNKINEKSVIIKGGLQEQKTEKTNKDTEKNIVSISELREAGSSQTPFKIIDNIMAINPKDYYDINGMMVSIIVLEAKRLFLEACKLNDTTINVDNLSREPFVTAFNSMSIIISKIYKNEFASEIDANVLLYIAKSLYDICNINDDDENAAILYEYLNYFLSKVRKEK